MGFYKNYECYSRDAQEDQHVGGNDIMHGDRKYEKEDQSIDFNIRRLLCNPGKEADETVG